MSSSRLSKTAESPISQIIRRESYLEKELQVCDRDHRLPGMGGAIFNSGVLIEVFALQLGERAKCVRPQNEVRFQHAVEEGIHDSAGRFYADCFFLGYGLRYDVHAPKRLVGMPSFSRFFGTDVPCSLCAHGETWNLKGQRLVLRGGYFELHTFALPSAR